jgi:hypothetical protein
MLTLRSRCLLAAPWSPRRRVERKRARLSLETKRCEARRVTARPSSERNRLSSHVSPKGGQGKTSVGCNRFTGDTSNARRAHGDPLAALGPFRCAYLRLPMLRARSLPEIPRRNISERHAPVTICRKLSRYESLVRPTTGVQLRGPGGVQRLKATSASTARVMQRSALLVLARIGRRTRAYWASPTEAPPLLARVVAQLVLPETIGLPCCV